jgi:hypothetical protein
MIAWICSIFPELNWIKTSNYRCKSLQASGLQLNAIEYGGLEIIIYCTGYCAVRALQRDAPAFADFCPDPWPSFTFWDGRAGTE